MFRIVAALVLFAFPVLADDITGTARIVDGDTIWISDTKIRLWGIDAPETKQTCTRDGKPWRCGEAATEALRQFIGTSTVTCESHGKDRYGRMIGKCSVNGLDIGAEMVSRGLALAYTRYSRYYLPNQNEAHAAGAGMFAGQFMPPWEWRRK
jgi:endonuclease YncB( thermonuclease family)